MSPRGGARPGAGRPKGSKGEKPAMVMCPVRVTPDAAIAAREMGGEALSALILRSARARRK